jgi:hypothetical protein
MFDPTFRYITPFPSPRATGTSTPMRRLVFLSELATHTSV